ncbi:VOC family protein [Alicyclobacillus sp. ALC3]|uniref:VOC family protein n=1 Tax=Alicyclobacillus sp. ALC3 TaxID=2796143 RepID=UPI0023782F8C|nr:VOC family protein [Alicyclobacillus sp. ALC3]WDL96696.1 VOC family protein [Alicyclobacillus sp. ALC3]
MKLRFLFYPVPNAVEAARFDRDHFGWEEVWRERDLTICLRIPGSEIGLLLDQDDANSKSGGFFEVPSVDEFYSEHQESISFVQAPADIPPGRYAVFVDPAGNPVRIFDNSKDN